VGIDGLGVARARIGAGCKLGPAGAVKGRPLDEAGGKGTHREEGSGMIRPARLRLGRNSLGWFREHVSYRLILVGWCKHNFNPPECGCPCRNLFQVPDDVCTVEGTRFPGQRQNGRCVCTPSSVLESKGKDGKLPCLEQVQNGSDELQGCGKMPRLRQAAD